MTMKINKRAGREKELREKIKKAIDRYESVFGKTLSVSVLEEYCREELKRERMRFLQDRLGQFSEADVVYVQEFLKERGKSSELPPKMDDDEEDIEVDEDEDAEEEEEFDDGLAA